MAAVLLSSSALAWENTEMIRLHVIAESDSPGDQALKLEIRDACLDCARACVSGTEDADAAYMRLEANVDLFRAACVRRARELGYAGDITAETGVFAFPDRVYGDALVPAGDYRALRIVIGDGAGKNWWCVLYPDLCLLDADAPGLRGVISWLQRRLGGGEHV